MEKIRVALIEDEALIRTGLRESLSTDERCQWVGEAVDGPSGLQLISQTQPDVAIVDIGLPGMSGIEMTQQLKAWPTDQQCRVMILTFNHSEEMVLAAFAAGADAYCMKDSRPALLLEAIQATHAGFAWIDPAIARIVLAQPPVPRPLSPHRTVRHNLTDRELEVLQLIVDGCSNADIADALYITVGTVKTHVRNILNKLSADDRTQAAVRALRSGLVG
ncbi:MAG: response regulator transcription factor [Synechocystis sp.]|nr:response regulator transcription factor [Synechocystis sp.]